MHLPIGVSDYKKLIEQKDPTQKGYLYVDKSLFIKEIIYDLTEVIVLTRPRRFGKTLNLSMLQYFFAAKVNGQATAGLFNGLAISKCADCMQEQGKYAVIFISFKDAKYKKFELCYEHVKNQIKNIYAEYSFLLDSEQLSNADRTLFNKIITKEVDRVDFDESLKTLTKFIYAVTGQQSIILIDEYDTPIQEAYLHGYYNELISFMRNLLSSGLKDNSFIKKAILTGILRVSKESLFSGLSNVEVYSVLQEQYSEYFGFTAKEVNMLLTKAKLPVDTQQTKEWFNGYNFANTTIYNPLSIIKFIKEKGKLKSYWVNTSGNELIKQLIIKSEPAIKDKISTLIAGASIKEIIDEHIVFGDLDTNPSSLWNLFLMSGYLKAALLSETMDGNECELSIPNKEIESLYRRIIRDWLSGARGLDWYREFLDDLANGRAEQFEEKLQTLIDDTLSYHDVTKKSQESFYHGLMLAFVSGLKETHNIKSNKESGKGRYDVAIIPKVVTKLGIVIEFKAIADETRLAIEAKKALTQSKKTNYIAELKSQGINNICQLGIAFSGKAVRVLAHHQTY